MHTLWHVQVGFVMKHPVVEVRAGRVVSDPVSRWVNGHGLLHCDRGGCLPPITRPPVNTATSPFPRAAISSQRNHAEEMDLRLQLFTSGSEGPSRGALEGKPGGAAERQAGKPEAGAHLQGPRGADSESVPLSQSATSAEASQASRTIL